MDSAIIITAIGAVSTFSGLFLKGHFDNKNRKKDSNEILEAVIPLKTKIEEQTIKLDDLKSEIDDIKKLGEFKHLLSETIRQKATQIITYSNLTDRYKNILMAWATYAEDLAFKFYRSKSRGDEDDLNNSLNINTTKILSDINTYQLALVPEYRIHNEKIIDFSTHMERNSKVLSKIFILVDRLVENGLGNKETISLFEKFVCNLLEANIDGFISWEELTIEKTIKHKTQINA